MWTFANANVLAKIKKKIKDKKLQTELGKSEVGEGALLDTETYLQWNITDVSSHRQLMQSDSICTKGNSTTSNHQVGIMAAALQ